MGKRDQRFDTYIKESPEFARPILTHIRETVHGACPDVEETFKWSHPHLVYHGAPLNTFEAFSPGARKEYIEWITEAKTEGTRSRRLEQAVEWMAEGKQRNWKYQK